MEETWSKPGAVIGEPMMITPWLAHYEYRQINVAPVTRETDNVFEPALVRVANHWAAEGWEPVLFLPERGMPEGDALLIRRVLPEGERA